MGAFFLSLLGGGWGLVKRGLQWLGTLNIWQLLCLGLGLLLVVQTARLHGAERGEAKAKAQVVKCAEARRSDQAAYRRAQAEAKARNEAQVQRIESEQQRISNNVEADLNARLERLRRELRAKPAAQSPAGSSEAGRVPQAPAPANGASGVCLTSEQLLRAAENEERHDQLLNWIEQQLGVKR